jgi:ABC-2 type transport system permease protein
MNANALAFRSIVKKDFRHIALSGTGVSATLFFLLGTALPFFAFNPEYAAAYDFVEYASFVPYALILAIPALAANAWSDEIRAHTIDWLISAPVGEWTLVMGKYCALLATYAVMLLLSVPEAFVPALVGGAKLDIGGIFVSYLFFFLSGAMLIALAQAISLLCGNGVIAFLASSACALCTALSHLLPGILALPDWLARLLQGLSLSTVTGAAGRGVLESRNMATLVLLTFAFLYANVASLRYRRGE